jgi:sulfotransferase family protein
MKLNKVALHGVPRSGTSWLGAIIDSSKEVIYRNQPLFSYAFKSFLDENATNEKIDAFFNEISKSQDDFLIQKEGKQKQLIPSFAKKTPTHIVYKEARYHHIIENMMKKDDSVMVLGIVRNPKSVIASWIEAPKEFDKERWNIFEEWKNAPSKNNNSKEEFYGYQKWKEVTELFLHLKNKYPDRFYLIDYSKILRNTEEEVKCIFEFLKLDFGTQTLDFLKSGQKKDLSNEPYSVYRIKQSDDKWKKTLPQEIIQEIDKDLTGTKLDIFL